MIRNEDLRRGERPFVFVGHWWIGTGEEAEDVEDVAAKRGFGQTCIPDSSNANLLAFHPAHAFYPAELM